MKQGAQVLTDKGKLDGGEPERAGGTILFVDDEPIVRKVGSRLLEHLGYEVVLAANGEEAVRALESAKGEIDLVILDLYMPKMDGPACFELLRGIDPGIPVLVASGDGYDSRIERMLEHEGVQFLKKPFGAEEIGEAVARGIKGLPEPD